MRTILTIFLILIFSGISRADLVQENAKLKSDLAVAEKTIRDLTKEVDRLRAQMNAAKEGSQEVSSKEPAKKSVKIYTSMAGLLADIPGADCPNYAEWNDLTLRKVEEWTKATNYAAAGKIPARLEMVATLAGFQRQGENDALFVTLSLPTSKITFKGCKFTPDAMLVSLPLDPTSPAADLLAKMKTGEKLMVSMTTLAVAISRPEPNEDGVLCIERLWLRFEPDTEIRPLKSKQK